MAVCNHRGVLGRLMLAAVFALLLVQPAVAKKGKKAKAKKKRVSSELLLTVGERQ